MTARKSVNRSWVGCSDGATGSAMVDYKKAGQQLRWCPMRIRELAIFRDCDISQWGLLLVASQFPLVRLGPSVTLLRSNMRSNLRGGHSDRESSRDLSITA